MNSAANNKTKIGKVGIIALGLWVVMAAAVAWKWGGVPPEIPLLYSLPDGEAQLGTRNGLVVLVGAGLVVTGINLWLAMMLSKRDKLAGQFMVWAAVLVNFMTLVTVFKIVTLIAA